MKRGWRILGILGVVLLVLGLGFLWALGGGDEGSSELHHLSNDDPLRSASALQAGSVVSPRRPGVPIMGRMGNATIKAELGRSSWRVLHTMASKFPYNPTAEQQQALLDFLYLFARLYPCGDCAEHFARILEANPPDVRDREAIVQWTCKVHNLVNARLHKPQFDCSRVGDMWKCGCDGEEEEVVVAGKGEAAGGSRA